MKNNVATFEFKPFSWKQKKLMTWWMDNCPYQDCDTVIADGSIRSGKTVAMINGFIDWSLAEFEHENFILAGKTMGALTRNVLNPMKKMLNAKGLDYNHIRSTEEPRIEIGTNKYYVFGANDKSSKDSLQGLTAAGSYLDEAALFPKNFVEESIGRCSVEGSRNWWNCNPQGPYHYIKEEYIDKAEEKKILRLKFNLNDNLTLSESIKKKYERMYDGVFYQRNILGKWVLAEGTIYDMFHEDIHEVSKLPNMKKHWIGVDYGTSNATVFILVGLGVNNKLYVIDEWGWGRKEKGTSKRNSQLREELENFIKKHNVRPEWIFIDPSAASFITELYDYRNDFKPFKRVAKANNEVLPGIRKVGNLLGIEKLLIHIRCNGAKKEFTSYCWDEKAQQRGEDKPLEEHDHRMDAIRYVINGLGKLYKTLIRRAT